MTEPRNEVLLVGRIPAPAEAHTMSNGDVLVSFRLVVVRPPSQVKGERSPTVDTIDCVARTARTRRSALAWVTGETVEVRGALRRRFWRAGTGAVSRTEVEIATAKRLDT